GSRHGVPGAAEALDALAVGFTLGAIAGEAIQRQPAKGDLEDPVAAVHEPEPSVHAGAGLQLGGARGHGEGRPRFQALAAPTQQVTCGLGTERVERATLGADHDRLAERGARRGVDRRGAGGGERDRGEPYAEAERCREREDPRARRAPAALRSDAAGLL